MTSLQRPRELLQTIWDHCEPVLPAHPGPTEGAKTSVQLKNELTKWSHSCSIVASSLKNAAIWFERFDRLDDANRLRVDGEKLTKLWHETYSNYNAETMKSLRQQLPGESIDGYLDRMGNYNGMNLAQHIYRVGSYASLLLESIEANEELCGDTVNESSPATHSPDVRSVKWFDTVYSFTPNQAACVKVLWEAWEIGAPEVGGPTLLEAADSNCQRIDIVFRGNNAWDAMIVQGGTKGSYRLADPTIDAPLVADSNGEKNSVSAKMIV